MFSLVDWLENKAWFEHGSAWIHDIEATFYVPNPISKNEDFDAISGTHHKKYVCLRLSKC